MTGQLHHEASLYPLPSGLLVHLKHWAGANGPALALEGSVAIIASQNGDRDPETFDGKGLISSRQELLGLQHQTLLGERFRKEEILRGSHDEDLKSSIGAMRASVYL